MEITGVRLLNQAGEEHSTFASGEPMTVAIDFIANQPVDGCVFGLGFKRADGVSLAGPNTKVGRFTVRLPAGGRGGTVTYTIPSLALLGAHYRLTAVVYDTVLNHAYDHREDITDFRVVDEQGKMGYVDLGGEWGERLDDDPT